MTVTVSATLAVNEALEAKRRQGVRVLPLGFGEAVMRRLQHELQQEDLVD
jgi:hypothetical protein